MILYRLLAAVVQMALRDLQKRRYQDGAQAFIKSQVLELYGEWLGRGVEATQQAVAEGVVQYKRWG